ncbi:MipA/OmpV family protein [Collimonas sp. H4R21]|uniref:MipA/OmpV family protein n=1 Tax=Collimonas rhizosphaerae TaxID=3126357 RepID=A0ABU9PQA7_9BURK
MPQISRFSLRYNRSCSATIVALASVLVWGSASAQTASTDASTWTLGGGVSVIKKGYRDIDRDVLPLPLISYESKWISASVPTLDVKLNSNENLSMRLRARYAGDGYDTDDSPFLAGMDDRKGSIWIGGAVIWRPQFANLSAEVLHDVSGYSKGVRAKLQVNRRFAFGTFGVTPRLGVEWVDSKYVDYYYGVKTSEVRAGRGFYQGNSTANIEAGVRLDYSIARRHTVFFDVRSSRFGSAIKDSPLVDQSSETGVSLGYIYRF